MDESSLLLCGFDPVFFFQLTEPRSVSVQWNTLVAMATECSAEENIHRFHVRAEGHHQHPLCQLHAGFTHEWVSVKMQFCSIHSSPYTPTGHLLHQMHAGISQPDRLTRWTVQTIRLSADMQNRFKKMGLEETSNSAALNFAVQDTQSCCLICTMSVQTHRLWCFYVWDECSLF